ncbi:AbgT family transporter [Streptomyces sp. NPDC012474]|uniref:AbgT family transporter n=1 Tax=Streptomyces sp. NPDC012474 TaxID=3364836 RepID=UPI0036ECFC26
MGVEESFLTFGPLGTMIIIMLGLAVADRSGMLESLARHALGRVSPGYAVFAVCLAGALSKFLSYSAYVILIPLAALVFKAVGRSPVLGMIVGFLPSRRERRVRPRWSGGLDGAVGVDDNDPVRAVVREGAVLCREDDDVGAGVRKLVSSMLGRPPVTRRTGPGVPAAVTGIRSGVPLSKLVAHRAPLWNRSPLAPIGRTSVGTGARAVSVSHGADAPPATGTDAGARTAAVAATVSAMTPFLFAFPKRRVLYAPRRTVSWCRCMTLLGTSAVV